MKNIMKSVIGLFVLGGAAFTSCTDVESLTVNETTFVQQNPEQYAKYLSNLCAYKQSEHKVVYAWFDNSEKAPFSGAQHMTNMPDSIDVLSLTSAQLEEFEKTDMEQVRQKGTKIFYTVSYDDIKAVYDELAGAGDNPNLEAFDVYLKAEVEKALGGMEPFDGLIAEFIGKNPTYMSTADKNAYKTTQDIFLKAVSDWKTANDKKELAFQGKPQNLIDKAVLANCKHIIMEAEGLATDNQLTLSVKDALVANVPADRFVISVSTVSIDAADKKTGYWDTDAALDNVAYWVTAENAEFTKAGIAIYNVQNDYYNTGGACTNVKEAINIMNPAFSK